MKSKKKSLLSIAGFDPTGGAGVLLDIQVFQYLSCRGFGILTSLTAQNSKNINQIRIVPSKFLWQQYKSISEEIDPDGIKIGMIGSRNNLQIISNILKENQNIPRVIDPVFKSTSGTDLIEKDGISQYIQAIKKNASILTPNMDEATLLSGIKIRDKKDMETASEYIFDQTKIPCLLKGGHLKGKAVDILFDGSTFNFFEKERINKQVHGTGCFLSSSILALLAKGESLIPAVSLAVKLTNSAIQNALPIGKGQDLIQFPDLLHKKMLL